MSQSPVSLDPVALSALLASRLCHDLINPVGALGSGLDVLEEEGMDQGMKDAALDLIRSGGAKSIALLKYARIAYGAAGGRGAELPWDEAHAVLRELFNWTKADLVWRVTPGQAAKEKVKAVLILAYAAADCVPRGGEVVVDADGDRLTVRASGPRAILQDDLVAALRGDAADLKPKFAPAYVAGLLAREFGGDVEAGRDGDAIILSANFASSAAFAAAR